jgi:four helix bundle protein
MRDQHERASLSIALNIAEASGRVSPEEKAHFFAIARGSAAECAALVDIIFARGLTHESELRHARGLLLRIVQMLSRLALRPTSRS